MIEGKSVTEQPFDLKSNLNSNLKLNIMKSTRNTTNKKNSIKSGIGVIAFFLVCVALGGLLGYSLTAAFGDTLSLWQAGLRILEGVMMLMLAFFLQIILHEAGHMVAALIRGWSFVSFMILGIVFSRKDG